MPPDLLQVRTAFVTFYVFRDTAGLVLLDAGFIGGRSILKNAISRKGWGDLPIVGIIVTHGHMDHILNVGRLAEETGAWIAAPRLDLLHFEGQPEYHGAARVTGALEACARPLFRFQPFTPTRLLDDGDELDLWEGLKVVHLPGHTAGHSGFYCEKHKLLFSADLFASYRFWPQLPPSIFNLNGDEVAASVQRALALDLKGVLPNHGDTVKPAEHFARLRRWMGAG